MTTPATTPAPASPPCPDIGAWRAWLDGEAARDNPAGEHLTSCLRCRRLVAELRQEAAVVHDALGALAPLDLPSAAETAVARERLEWRRRGRAASPTGPSRIAEPGRGWVSRLTTPWRVGLSGLAAALALSLVVAFTPEGGAAAASFLSQFRSQGVAAVEVSPQTQADIVRTLTALGNLGTVNAPGALAQARPEAAARSAAQQVRTVTLAEASQAIGFAVQTPDPSALPAGIGHTPEVRVYPASQVRFTFDKNKARGYLQTTGHPEVDLPDKYDGASLVVSIPAAALLQYTTGSSRDELIIGEAGELVVDVEGGKVSLPEMRDFLLGLPGLPQSTVSQLKQIQNWNETLPIPIPVDRVNWQSTRFNGNQGLLLNDNSGVGSAAIWHASGHLFGVAGSIKARDLEHVANSLAVR